MTSRRVLTAVLMLVVAIMACSPGGTTLPATDTPAPRPTSTTRAPRPTSTTGAARPTKTAPAPTDVAATEDQPTSEAPTPEAQPTQAKLPTRVPATRVPRPTATPASSASCDTFNPSDVAWVTLDANGNPAQQVDSYPDGTTVIAAYIEYDCVPKALTLVTNWGQDGQQVGSAKAQLKATDAKDHFTSTLDNGGNPLSSGDYSVAFYVDKQLVSQGTVTVGGGGGNTSGNSNSTDVTVEGTVTDQASGQPIKGAAFVVLQPGITYKQFVNDNGKTADIYVLGLTDAQGQFALNKPLQRNQVYSVAVGAVPQGYPAIYNDKFVIDDSAPDPLVLTVQLTH